MTKVKKSRNTVISVFGLDDNSFRQSSVDFFNVNLDKDNLAFVDYNRLSIQSDRLSLKMNEKLNKYLFRLFSSAATNKAESGLKLLEGVRECNHTFLGYSAGRPSGNSMGRKMKPIFLEALAFLKSAYLQDQLSLNALRFGIKNISYDRVSDITVSVLKEYLIEYTQNQCAQHNIECDTKTGQFVFDIESNVWEQKSYLLPNYNGKPIILIPKKLISSRGKAVCSIKQFVSFGFKTYIQNSPEVQHLKTDGKLTYKAYKAYLKKSGKSLKDVAGELLGSKKEILLDFESFQRPSISEMTSSDLEDITNSD